VYRSRRAFLAAAAGLAGCTGGGDGDAPWTVATATGPPPTLGSVEGAWSHPQGDAAATRYVAGGRVPGRPPRAAWTFEGEWSQVVVAGGTAYLGNTDGVVALDAATGERRWEWTDDARRVVGHVVEEAVYAAVGRDVVALSPEDGRTLWRASTDRNDVLGLVADGETAYVATDGGRDVRGAVTAFAAGELQWRHVPEEITVARFDSLAVGEDTVVAAGENVGGTSWHVALDGDGEQRWQTPGLVKSRALTVSGGTVLAGGLHGSVLAQSVADGTIHWRGEAGPGVEVVATDGDAVYVAGKDEDGDNCRALAMADGSERWSTPVGRTVIATDDRVLVAGQGRVRGLDAATGTVRWQRRRPGTPRSLALVDGALFSVGDAGTLRALTA
jgi:outer membrane protein assembly factor BamB